MTNNYDPPGATGSEPQTPEPDFLDVHVKLDLVIRVHGTTEDKPAKDIAADFLADQDLHRLLDMQSHEDGLFCDGDEEWVVLDENGDLVEDQLTVALYPDDRVLPTDLLVRTVASYPRRIGNS